MKTAVILALLATVCAQQAFAAPFEANQDRPRLSLEQKKSEILRHIDKRIADGHAEKGCVQSAQSHEELKACHDKYRPKPKGGVHNRNQQPDQM